MLFFQEIEESFRKGIAIYRVLMSILLALPCSAQDDIKRTKEELHALHHDSKTYIAMLEDPQRDSYQKPHEVLMALELKEGEVIADVGAGSGYFSFRIAHHVGEKGRVYAVDVSPDMILFMNRRIRDLGTKNVITVLAPPDDPLLPNSSVDRFFICDTWHHIENQTQYLTLLKKMLKPDGQIIMIDFQKRELPVGPPMEMKIAREDLISQMELAEIRLVKEFTFLPYQYFLVFKPKSTVH
jgi:ubiquinone/menaquinone biosynthesis C-methylase UbiE